MNEELKRFYARQLYRICIEEPNFFVGSIIMDVAAELCMNEDMYKVFQRDVASRQQHSVSHGKA